MEEISPNNILKVSHISASYQEGKQRKTVLHDISFELHENEILGLVGESGCGKSTLSKVILGFIRPDEGEIISQVDHPQMIFQDPFSSLNPAKKISWILEEPLRMQKVPKEERKKRVLAMAERVGLSAEHLKRRPHELSGGQRQRIGIARAIALQPDLLVCDEPVSALDVSVQSQVLNLLKDLQKQYGLTYLFIGHDLSVINFIADRVCVMFLGHVCEVATKEELYSRPMHPYTAFLMDAIPQADPHRRNQHRRVLMGEVPSPVNLPSGCCFHTRCPYATERCRTEVPELREWDGRMVACHRAGENWD